MNTAPPVNRRTTIKHFSYIASGPKRESLWRKTCLDGSDAVESKRELRNPASSTEFAGSVDLLDVLQIAAAARER